MNSSRSTSSRYCEPSSRSASGVSTSSRSEIASSGGSGSSRAAPSHPIQRGVAAHQDQPRCRIARRPVARPVLQRAQAGFLECLLGGIEVAEIAQQRADRLGSRGGERRVDPGDVAHPAPRVRAVQRDRADLVGAAGIGRGEFARDIQRLVQIGDVDHIEAEQLLLRLGERAVDHQRRVLRLAQRGGRGGGQQAQRRPELARLGQPLLHDAEPRHDGGVLLLAPGPDDVLVVVAEDGVEHADRSPGVPQDAGVCPLPTGRRKKVLPARSVR